MFYSGKSALINLILFSLIFISCANQKPPSGGENDEIPPKIISITPAQNTRNFTGREIEIEFDEYVDRRSFEESFYISPKPKGKINYDWSGKKVTITFENVLEKNKTYNVSIGTDLKDIRAGNKLKSPVNFAFSTGDMIDMCSIEGRVYAKNFNNIIIAAYNLDKYNNKDINPEKDLSDYFTLLNENGSYELRNISEGNYKLFSIRDNDKNFLFDRNFEEISVLHSDIYVSDSSKSGNANFLMYDFDFIPNSEKFISSLLSDTSGLLYSSLRNNSTDISVLYKYYFYFKSNTIDRFDIANGISLIDTTGNNQVKIIYNWLSDSLLEVIPAKKLDYSTVYKFIISIKINQKNISKDILFSTRQDNKSFKISGEVRNMNNINPVIIKLYDDTDPINEYSIGLRSDSLFKFEDVSRGDYHLFAFIDENGNNTFDKGTYFPFKPSEKFYFLDKLMKISGKMNYENIFIDFY